MVMEVVLNAVPSICAQLFFFATNANLGNYWGQMTTLLNAVYVALCSIFYWKILAKKASTGVFLIRNQTIMTSSSNTVV
ncbi:hypothetical protein Ddc_15007 [Ditylenchus destructor]|nr:hypothetical protein Ddc_15007 [Ditylenchus destructor]